MADCPHCRPLLDESARWQTIEIDLVRMTDSLLAQRANEIGRAQLHIANAWTHWRQQFAAWQAAKAQLEALQQAVAAGGLHPDLSLTPVAGWIAHQLPSGLTIYARDEDALQHVTGAVTSGGALAQLPAAQAAEAAASVSAQAAADAVNDAEAALDALIKAWDARLAQHQEAIATAARNKDDYYRQYLACQRSCIEDEKRNHLAAGAAAALLVFGTLGLVLAGGGTASGSEGAVVAGPPVTVAESPLEPAVFDAPASTVAEPATPEPEPDAPAQTVLVIACSGTDHFPEQPVIDDRTGNPVQSPSLQRLGIWTTGLEPGTILVVTVDGPGGVREADGVVGDDGFVLVDVPLYDYGEHTVTGTTTVPATDAPLELGGTFVVSDPEEDCDQGTAGPPPTTAPPVSTTAPQTGGTAPPPSTTPPGGGSFTPPPTVTPPEEGETVTGTLASPETPTERNLPLTMASVASLVGGAALLGATGVRRRYGGTTPPGTPATQAFLELVERILSGERSPEEPDGGPFTLPFRRDQVDGIFDRFDEILEGLGIPPPTRPRTQEPEAGPIPLGELWDRVTDYGKMIPVALVGGTASDGTEVPGVMERMASAAGGLARQGLQLLSTSARPGTEPAPEPAEPSISIRTGGGTDSVNGYQSFQIVVELPRGSEPPPEEVTVEISAESGDDETITLAWDGNVTGPARYVSQPITLKSGGEGEGSVTIGWFEFTTGGFDSLWFDNGEKVTLTYGEASTSFIAYDTWVQQGIGRSMAVVERYESFARNLLTELEGLPDTDQTRKLRTWAEQVLTLTDVANKSFASDHGDTVKLAVISAYASKLPWVGSRDFRDLMMEASQHARTRREEYKSRVLNEGLTGITLGLYRTVVEATPAASGWTLFTGTDIMGKEATWDARVLAALELAGWATLAGGLEARAFAGTVAGESKVTAAAAKELAGTDVPSRPRAPDAPDAPTTRSTPEAPGTRVPDPPTAPPRPRTPRPDPDAPIDASILRKPAGTPVTDVRPFGMRPEVADHFQSVADRYGVRVRVRAANQSSLRWMEQGNPPKHVKLKSKTINDLDIQLGAPEGSQGLVGYFRPKLPANIDSLPPDLASALRKRHTQRLKEYYDNWKDIERLKEKGLISVEDGVVVDRGLSSTRLGPDGQLHRIDGPPEGTGKGFTGDHDMWDITNPDGSVITDPDGLARKAAAERDLATGPANTQHGPHKDWVPSTERDRGIDAKIRESHQGQVNPDGSVGPRMGPDADGNLVPQSEGLLEFGPGRPPSVSYEMGDGK